MNIENLLLSEIQEIKIAIEERKQRRWNSLIDRFKQNITLTQRNDLKNEFDSIRNHFTIEGRCNKILGVIQDIDSKIQKEIE